jgi:hypothetical protein
MVTCENIECENEAKNIFKSVFDDKIVLETKLCDICSPVVENFETANHLILR